MIITIASITHIYNILCVWGELLRSTLSATTVTMLLCIPMNYLFYSWKFILFNPFTPFCPLSTPCLWQLPIYSLLLWDHLVFLVWGLLFGWLVGWVSFYSDSTHKWRSNIFKYASSRGGKIKSCSFFINESTGSKRLNPGFNSRLPAFKPLVQVLTWRVNSENHLTSSPIFL